MVLDFFLILSECKNVYDLLKFEINALLFITALFASLTNIQGYRSTSFYSGKLLVGNLSTFVANKCNP